MDIIKDELDCFETIDGTFHYFVRFHKRKILCWTEDSNPIGGTYCYNSEFIDVTRLDESALTLLKIWGKLPKKLQEEIINRKEVEKTVLQEKMANIRKEKRKKYPNIPREITCTNCNVVVKTVPSLIAKKLEKSDSTIEKYTESFECTKCNPPVKGRQKNPANAPREMVCKCGRKISYPLNVIKKAAEKKKLNVEEFIKEYRCQICVPTRGRKKGYKKKKGKK